ncbi:hypothetical protein SALWKB12_0079 [Snodgrassella communis]|uniref:Uncharacterized protein n=1 Tax=Snodgrassella communis TaxID=2946699 RepID=A0A836MQV2_9NEIS|nr:hypothetical protein SALWKB12_0079 [Snodgrassella communis]KDN14457.1 hypothetical protein SALWKB29_1546 [Snodgrassella communis]
MVNPHYLNKFDLPSSSLSIIGKGTTNKIIPIDEESIGSLQYYGN